MPTWDPLGLTVYVEGDGLPEVPAGAMMPSASRRHEVGTRDGQPYASTTWEVGDVAFQR